MTPLELPDILEMQMRGPIYTPWGSQSGRWIWERAREKVDLARLVSTSDSRAFTHAAPLASLLRCFIEFLINSISKTLQLAKLETFRVLETFRARDRLGTHEHHEYHRSISPLTLLTLRSYFSYTL